MQDTNVVIIGQETPEVRFFLAFGPKGSTFWLQFVRPMCSFGQSITQDPGVNLSTEKQTRRFSKTLDELDSVFSFLDDSFAETAISEEKAFTVRLAVEEIFANMVKHNEPGHEAVTLSMHIKESALEVELIDHGVQPFKIPDMNEKDMDESARDGKTSGRGIYLIRKMVDDLTYEFSNGDSIVRLSIKIGSSDA